MSTATQPTNFEVGVDVVAGHELGAQRGLAHLARPQQQHPANIGQLDTSVCFSFAWLSN